MDSQDAAHLVVRIDGQRHALPVSSVDEVLRMAWVTPVPKSRAEVCGLLNLHGEVLAVLEPGVLLGGERRRPTSADYLVVVHLGEAQVALKVDGVEGLVEGERSAPAAESAPPGFVLGHLLVDEEPVVVLDVETLIDAELRAEVQRALEQPEAAGAAREARTGPAEDADGD